MGSGDEGIEQREADGTEWAGPRVPAGEAPSVETTAVERPRRAWAAAAIGLWAGGMLMLFHPILLTGMRRTFAGLGDVRLVNFTLEHGYRWLGGRYLHADFWSPPLFFPHRNVATYTDLVLGAAPPYWMLRAVDFAPVDAFLIWVFAMWTLNFIAAYLLCRRLFDIPVLGAGFGAFLFTFGNPRSAAIAHHQLAPAFYLLAAFAAVVVVFDEPARRSSAARRGWIVVFFAALAAQFYTAFYPLYYFGLCLLVAAILGLIIKDYRAAILATARRDGWAIGLAGLGALAAVAPALQRYLQTAAEVGLRRYPASELPRPMSWVLMGPNHPWFGWLQQSDGPFFGLRQSIHSHGVGPVTTVVAIIGLYQAWSRRSVRLLGLVVIALILMTTVYPGGISGWRLIYDYLPGAAALRAVARVGMITLLPLALGVAFLFGELQRSRRWVWLAILGALVIVEQNHAIQFRERAPLEAYERALVDSLPRGCEAFLLVHVAARPYPHVNDDAAWVTLRTGVPTLNGRYGNFPPDYPLYDVHAPNPEVRAGVRRAMDYWVERNGLTSGRVCWIETRGFPPERYRQRR